MGFIEWVPSLDTGIDEIDRQHRSLVELINRLDKARTEGRGRDAIQPLLVELEAYVGNHFSTEEALFERFSYPGTAAHIAEHRVFSEKIKAFNQAFRDGSARVDSELLGFLKTWLTTHISFSDKKYRSHLRS